MENIQIKPRFWPQLFRFCLGLTLASAFCMKWLEPGFLANGKLFTIIGLELKYNSAMISSIYQSLDAKTELMLRANLVYDFAFMAGVYPGIAAICMLARNRSKINLLRNILLVFAVLQLLAWTCDIFENYCLLTWLNQRQAGAVEFYHGIVWMKWILAISGLLTGGISYFLNRRLK